MFLHVFEPDADGWLRLPPLARKVERAQLGGDEVEWRQGSGGLHVHVGRGSGTSGVTVVALDLDGARRDHRPRDFGADAPGAQAPEQ